MLKNIDLGSMHVPAYLATPSTTSHSTKSPVIIQVINSWFRLRFPPSLTWQVFAAFWVLFLFLFGTCTGVVRPFEIIRPMCSYHPKVDSDGGRANMLGICYLSKQIVGDPTVYKRDGNHTKYA